MQLVFVSLIGLIIVVALVAAIIRGCKGRGQPGKEADADPPAKDREPRYMTIPQAGEIYQAMNGDKEAQKTITFDDVAGLENAPTFEKFLQWNKNRIEIVDLVELSR